MLWGWTLQCPSPTKFNCPECGRWCLISLPSPMGPSSQHALSGPVLSVSLGSFKAEIRLWPGRQPPYSTCPRWVGQTLPTPPPQPTLCHRDPGAHEDDVLISICVGSRPTAQVEPPLPAAPAAPRGLVDGEGADIRTHGPLRAPPSLFCLHCRSQRLVGV